MCNISHIYGLYMNKKAARYDLGTVLAKYDVPNQFMKLWTMIPNEG